MSSPIRLSSALPHLAPAPFARLHANAWGVRVGTLSGLAPLGAFIGVAYAFVIGCALERHAGLVHNRLAG